MTFGGKQMERLICRVHLVAIALLIGWGGRSFGESRTTTYSYDAFGNVQTVTDPVGRTAGTEYDLLGRTTAVVDALGHTNRFQYDAWGSLTNLVDANGNHTGFEYDVAGRLTKKTYDDGTSHQYFYDGFGRLETAIDAKNQKSTYVYDVLGQLRTNCFFATASSAEPEKTVVYNYDDYGRMTYYDDGVTAGTVVYDDAQNSQTVTVDYGNGIAMISVYSYNQQTRQMTRINGSMTNVYSYGADGKLQSVSIPGEGDVTYQYDARGLNTEILLPGGNRRISGSDGFGQLESVQVQDTADNNVLSQSYQRDLTGSILQKQTDVGIWSYGYDRTSQLTNALLSANSVPLRENSFTYDAMGNRLFNRESTQGTQKETAYEPNNLNQYDVTISTNLTTSTGSTNNLLYDLNGNLTNDGVRAYSWDTQNQLIKVTPINPTTNSYQLTFAYDYMGRRISKKVSVYQGSAFTNQASHIFFYDGWNLVKEIAQSTNNVSTNLYVWGNDLSQTLQGAGGVGGLICMLSEASGLQPEVFFYCYDHNGNVEKVITGSGAVVAEYQYDAFGNEIGNQQSEIGNVNAFRFSTKYYDSEAGIYYYGYRFLNPDIGRWLSRDKIGERSFQATLAVADTMALPIRQIHELMSLRSELLQMLSFVQGYQKERMLFTAIVRINRQLLFLGNEMGLYSYVFNSPIGSYDILGLACPCGEALTQIGVVGPIDAARARAIADRALRAAQQSGLPGLRNGLADAFRHCVWSCWMAQEIGADQATQVGNIHEECGGNPPSETSMDLHNNQVGVGLGSIPGTDCSAGCMNAVRNGALQLSPGGTPPKNIY